MKKTYHDTTLPPQRRAELLLAELSLAEKMAQTRGYIPTDEKLTDFDDACRYGIGGISTLHMRGFQTIEECVHMQTEMQRMVMERGEHHIPAIFHMEGLCGAFIQGSTSFPSGIGRGASFDVELEEKIGRIVSRQERAMGITHILAPVLDVARDPRMGRQGESYGEDPALVSAMGAAYTKGIQSGQVNGLRAESVAKHFTGFHNAAAGIHGAYSEMGDRQLREVFAKPFQAAITEAGLRGIMPCYCSVNGGPVHISKEMLHELLRGEMGFEGLVFSDYGGLDNAYRVDMVGSCPADVGMMAMEAGMDMEHPSERCYNRELEERFASGELDIALLDRIVLRILTAKFRMGLFDQPFALSGDALRAQMANPEDAAVTRQSAAESLVLLKNTGVLPLSAGGKTIAVIGPHGDNPSAMFGGYTHVSMAEGMYAALASMAGMRGDTTAVSMHTYPGSQVQTEDVVPKGLVRHIAPTAKSLVEALREEFPDSKVLYAYGYPYIGSDTSGYEEALKTAQQADILILTLGGKHGTGSIASMGEGVDAVNINLPDCQDAFIRMAARLGKPMVGVHFNGRPISSDTADECLNAILEAWNPSEGGGEAIARVLSGRINPSGKLPVSVAYSAGQLPLYYNHPNGSAWHQAESIGFPQYVDMSHKPRYCFGYGLSYTTFQYDDLRISNPEAAPDEAVDISLAVTNTGRRQGTEVVQLYLSDERASMVRPWMELQGFARVPLEPGQTKRVRFRVRADQTAFLDREHRWKVEAGKIRALVGAASDDIRLTGEFIITRDLWIDGKSRGFYAQTAIQP